MANRWISARCASRGGNLRRDPSRQRKGPLRRITGLVALYEPDFFTRPYVILECGHKVFSDGTLKARCDQCRD